MLVLMHSHTAEIKKGISEDFGMFASMQDFAH
jgi:hypothetical protein